ncbi:MAG: ATP-binding protein [Bacteroidetes bacterium]|nr:ATP-binding protein [Bacteroidota bacterium]
MKTNIGNTDNIYTGKKYNILLIENNINMQRLLSNTFLKNGIELTAANTIIEGISILKENCYDLIIVNLDVDCLEHFSLCERIRGKHSITDLPIVGYSSKTNVQLIHNVLSAGYNDVFSLPFDIVEFSFKIKFLLEVKKISDKVKEQQSIIDTRTQVFKMNTHDLKNPLSSIFSLSGIPVSSFNDSEEISQTMSVIHNASKIMTSLVNTNLEFLNVTSNTIKLNEEIVDIVSLINQIVEINTPLAKNKNQKIIFTYPIAECSILSDNNKLFQAINNIVGNAIKFSPFNKKIWIDVTKGEKIKIKIKDEGPGFKKEEVDNVLVKFGKHSATPTGDEISTGLGLLISKQIINLSKGNMYLESEEGKGATFTLEFPIDTD